MFYDGCYNPTYYRTFIFEWNNIRQLTWCRNTDGNALKDTTFAYGSDGIRCRKNNIYYTLDGNRILKEYNQDTGKTITYLYGEKGIVGFNYGGNDYYYRKDIHGDVLAIYNANGKVVASYQYDAWGKLIGQTDNSGIGLATLNPIRYRSYYYDTETGFYYLNARYYDPEIGRFLNADTPQSLGSRIELNNYNLFAYCQNNPVNRKDPSGLAWETIWDIASLAGSVAEVYANPSNPWAWVGLIGDVVDVALPCIGGLGEAVDATRTVVRFIDTGDDVVDTARQLRHAADAADEIRDATGSYVILYRNGQHYIGKGGFQRAITSAVKHLSSDDSVSAIIWAPTSSETSAFVTEYLLQSTLQSITKLNSKTFNQIWSPGKKIFKALQ